MTITQEQFDSLLEWLAADRDLAGRKYETIRSGLVRIFVSRGFNEAEDLADETINRVMVRLPEIRQNYVGEPAHYFHGVAKYVVRERARRREVPFAVVDACVLPKPEAAAEQVYLEQCLRRLPTTKRDFILDYYLYEGRDKVEHHKRMARQLKLTLGAFRSRAHQIRRQLQYSMRECPMKEGGRARARMNLHDALR